MSTITNCDWNHNRGFKCGLDTQNEPSITYLHGKKKIVNEINYVYSLIMHYAYVYTLLGVEKIYEIQNPTWNLIWYAHDNMFVYIIFLNTFMYQLLSSTSITRIIATFDT